MHLPKCFYPMLFLPFVLLCGCTGAPEDNDLTLALRSDFLSMEGCAGTMEVTADYGERVYEYAVQFTGGKEDGLTLLLTAPEEVAGITARIEKGQTFLEFDGVRLETGPLNAEGLSPLDALPALISAMQTGCIAETGTETEGERELLRLCCRDPEQEPGQGDEVILWFDKEQKTLWRGELRSNGSTVVCCRFSSFLITKAGNSAEQ